MSTLKRECVVGKTKNELDEFSCGICQELYRQPMVTNCCQQTYCKTCIEEWLRRRKTCPNCRNDLLINELFTAPRLVVNLLNEMSVKCDNHVNGCQELVAFGQFSSHLKLCQFNVCKTCGFKGNDEHNCLEFVKEKYFKVNEENEKYKTEIENFKEKNEQLQNLIKENNKLKLEMEKFQKAKLEETELGNLFIIMILADPQSLCHVCF